jgi:hypothetical protein
MPPGSAVLRGSRPFWPGYAVRRAGRFRRESSLTLILPTRRRSRRPSACLRRCEPFYYTAGTYNSTFRTGLSDTDHNFVQSGQVDAVSHTIFGLDLLYKPLNITLSSFGRISRDQSLFSLAVRKLLNS